MSKYSYVQDIEKLWPSFEFMWKDTFSVLPDLPLDWKEREKWKVFTEKVYNHILDHKHIKLVVEDAYEDGYNEGYDAGYDGAK